MKRLLSWVAVLVVLAVVAVVVDRVALGVAEGRAVSAVEKDSEVVGAQLDIEGFPFLTQVAAGELGHVTGSATSAVFGGLSVSDVRIEASGVGTSSPYTVSTGTASGAVAVASLQQLLEEETGLSGIELTVDGDALVMSASVLGLDLNVRVVPEVADPTTLAVNVESVTIGGATVPIEDLPGGLGDLLTDLSLSLTLPDGVTLDGVSVSGNAVRIDVSGQDVALEELVSS